MDRTQDPDLKRFQSLLDRYGAAPRRWPVDERAEALALLDRSAEARARLDAAQALDALLDQAPDATPSPTLRAAILAAAPAAASLTVPATEPRIVPAAEPPAISATAADWRRRLAAWLDLPGEWLAGWRPAGALAATMMLGLALGLAAPLPGSANGGDDLLLQDDSFELLAFGPNALEALMEEIAP